MGQTKSVQLKTSEQVEIIRANGLILANAHAEVAKILEPGVTTKQLDTVAETYIRDNGGIPSFKGYNGFPATLCISVNEVVVHGIPSTRVIKEGDIVSIDGGVCKNGFHADSAYTYGVGEISKEAVHLLKITKASLYAGIAAIQKQGRMGDVSYAIQHLCESEGFGIVRELVGHGVGRNLHEAPEVPNYGKRGNGVRLQSGMVIAIEPMVTAGKRYVVQEADNWTIRTEDRSLAAHFEHTVLITKEGSDILTTFAPIEAVLRQKESLIV